MNANINRLIKSYISIVITNGLWSTNDMYVVWINNDIYSTINGNIYKRITIFGNDILIKSGIKDICGSTEKYFIAADKKILTIYTVEGEVYNTVKLKQDIHFIKLIRNNTIKVNSYKIDIL